MRRRLGELLEVAAWLLALALVVLFVGAGIVGCGSGSSRPTSTTRLLKGPRSCDPTEGAGTMGVCSPLPVGIGKPVKLTGRIVPDVSFFQGSPNWQLAKPHISGAIVRVADGGFNDPAFARNWRELRRLGVWHAAYFFVRPGNCSAEAARAVALVRAAGGFDSGPLIADAEVPLNFGCAAAFVAEAKRLTGLVEVIYTAPGTWPGGPHGHALLWVASYGPTPGCVWTCAHVAWQFTDGAVGPLPHCTPGIGCDDLSLDGGITKLGVKPKPKPKPVNPAKSRSLHAHERHARRLAALLAHDEQVIARYRREGVR